MISEFSFSMSCERSDSFGRTCLGAANQARHSDAFFSASLGQSHRCASTLLSQALSAPLKQRPQQPPQNAPGHLPPCGAGYAFCHGFKNALARRCSCSRRGFSFAGWRFVHPAVIKRCLFGFPGGLFGSFFQFLVGRFAVNGGVVPWAKLAGIDDLPAFFSRGRPEAGGGRSDQGLVHYRWHALGVQCGYQGFADTQFGDSSKKNTSLGLSGSPTSGNSSNSSASNQSRVVA